MDSGLAYLAAFEPSDATSAFGDLQPWSTIAKHARSYPWPWQAARESALPVFERLLSDPDLDLDPLARGYLLYDLGRFDEAIQTLRLHEHWFARAISTLSNIELSRFDLALGELDRCSAPLSAYRAFVLCRSGKPFQPQDLASPTAFLLERSSWLFEHGHPYPALCDAAKLCKLRPNDRIAQAALTAAKVGVKNFLGAAVATRELQECVELRWGNRDWKIVDDDELESKCRLQASAAAAFRKAARQAEPTIDPPMSLWITSSDVAVTLSRPAFTDARECQRVSTLLRWTLKPRIIGLPVVRRRSIPAGFERFADSQLWVIGSAGYDATYVFLSHDALTIAWDAERVLELKVAATTDATASTFKPNLSLMPVQTLALHLLVHAITSRTAIMARVRCAGHDIAAGYATRVMELMKTTNAQRTVTATKMAAERRKVVRETAATSSGDAATQLIELCKQIGLLGRQLPALLQHVAKAS